MVLRRLSSCLVVVCALGAVSAAAQGVDPIAAPAASTSAQSIPPAPAPDVLVVTDVDKGPSHPQEHIDAADLVPMIDVGDLWRMIHHRETASGVSTSRHFFVVAPVIGSKPSTGFSGGVSSNIAFLMGEAATTHISTIIGGFRLSQKGQTLAGSRAAMFTDGDRWFILADNRISWTSGNVYALGGDSPTASGINLKYDAVRLYESAYRQVSPGLFIGAGLDFSSHYNARPSSTTSAASWNDSAYLDYNAQHGFSATRQDSNGTSVGIRYDTRDNGIDADKGALASATYRAFFSGFLGGDSTWQELYLDARSYKRLTKDARQKLAFWFLGDLVTGGTAPYWDLPFTSSDGRSARGYGEGRYRGEQMLYWEAEYRASLMKSELLGVVAFANVSTFENKEAHEQLFESYAPGAGFGFRVLLNKRSRTNLCADWGWGKQGSRGFYLSIQEAF